MKPSRVILLIAGSLIAVVDNAASHGEITEHPEGEADVHHARL